MGGRWKDCSGRRERWEGGGRIVVEGENVGREVEGFVVVGENVGREVQGL